MAPGFKAAVLFDNLGPYHVARLKAAAGVADVVAVEFGGQSVNYAWADSRADFKVFTLNPSGTSWEMSPKDFKGRLYEVLDRECPDIVFIPGWATPGPLFALKWCLKKGTPAVIMSESTPWDAPRVYFREWIKSRIVSLGASAFVGGMPQRDYMIQLGMPAERIFTGYNMVDNDFFITHSDFQRRKLLDTQSDSRRPYFLASSRFIYKKNLFFLLDAYAGYVESLASSAELSTPWPLVLLGDGELREPLLEHARKLGLDMEFTAPWEGGETPHPRGCVYFPGFRQVNELPRFYAEAGAFVHASMSEQWGLVVNEAMASELPVLVSKPCGCAIDLVKEGENGYTFVAFGSSALSNLLLKIYLMDPSSRKKMGQRSRSIVSQWGAEHFAEGFRFAAEAALQAPPKGAKIFARLLLEVFCRRFLA